MTRPAGRTAGWVRSGLLVAAAGCLLALAAADDASGQPAAGEGPVSSSSYQTAARFADLEYPVSYLGAVFHTQHPYHRTHATATDPMHYLAEVDMVERPGSDLDLSIAVEGQSDRPRYQFCESSDKCGDVIVQAAPAGQLYLYTPPFGDLRLRRDYTYLGGFPRRSVELSASDAASGLKVYREVLVGPPSRASGCEDYDDYTPDAFTCLFNRELLPAAPVTGAGVETLRDGLPGLVQDSDNYRLVFAEEFDGARPPANADGCRDGLSTLDPAVWSYGDACLNVDSKGEPCNTVADGAMVIALSGSCGVFVSTFGLLAFKYGYVEIKYTVDAYRWPGVYANYNLLLWGQNKRANLRDQYGIVIEDWEDYLKRTEVEIDILEWEVNSRRSEAHQYANWHFSVARRDLAPVATNKMYWFCRSHRRSIGPPPFAEQGGTGKAAAGGAGDAGEVDRSSDLPVDMADLLRVLQELIGQLPGTTGTDPECPDDATFTVTWGLEWTPRGYRNFVKVDDVHSELTLVPKDKITLRSRPVTESKGRLKAGPQVYGALPEDEYFEYLVPGDTGSLLEKVGVSHIPLPVVVNTWGHYNPDDHPYIRTRMHIDYIRVWQPENLYTDMEPVYQ